MRPWYSLSRWEVLRGPLGPASGVLMVCTFVGSMAYAIVAMESATMMTPGAEVIAVMAHGSGSYYPKLAMISTWGVTFFGMIAPFAMLWAATRAAWRATSGGALEATTPLPDGPGWTTLFQRSSTPFLLGGVGLLAAGLPVVGLLLVRHDLLYSLGWFADLLLVFSPLACVGGLALFLDGVFLPHVQVGVVEGLEIENGGRAAVRHEVVCGGARWTVPREVFEVLAAGMPFAVRATRVTRKALEVRASAVAATPAP